MTAHEEQGPVTRAEMTAHLSPMKKDISDIAKAVKPIPAILVQTTATNGKVASQEERVDKLEDWQQRIIGAGGIILLLITVFGAVLLREVL